MMAAALKEQIHAAFFTEYVGKILKADGESLSDDLISRDEKTGRLVVDKGLVLSFGVITSLVATFISGGIPAIAETAASGFLQVGAGAASGIAAGFFGGKHAARELRKAEIAAEQNIREDFENGKLIARYKNEVLPAASFNAAEMAETLSALAELSIGKPFAEAVTGAGTSVEKPGQAQTPAAPGAKR